MSRLSPAISTEVRASISPIPSVRHRFSCRLSLASSGLVAEVVGCEGSCIRREWGFMLAAPSWLCIGGVLICRGRGSICSAFERCVVFRECVVEWHQSLSLRWLLEMGVSCSFCHGFWYGGGQYAWRGAVHFFFFSGVCSPCPAF